MCTKTSGFNLILVLLICCSKRTLGDSKESRKYEVDTDVEIITGRRGTKGGSHSSSVASLNPYAIFSNFEPSWRASAHLRSDNPEHNVQGEIHFHQWNPNNLVKITCNITGIPAGKHAVHIHMFGDTTQGCRSTGMHMQNNFIGNLDVPANGVVSASFFSGFLTLFGYNGIIGRSIVIHQDPIVINNLPDVYSSSVHAIPNHAISYHSEEQSVGPPIACGAIIIAGNMFK